MSLTEGGMGRMVTNLVKGGLSDDKVQNFIKGGKKVNDRVDDYTKMYEKGQEDDFDTRKKDAPNMVDAFYDLVTDFYESGWGQSFHFAPRHTTESFRESISRHEYYMAAKMGITPEDFVLDVGCGIGGPMRNIAKFTGAKVVGVTINSYQVKRGNDLNRQSKLDHLCQLEECNFLQLKWEDNTFDKVFSIEATCHAPDRSKVFAEAYRVLKPGGVFATYEWVLTENYDKNNDAHKLAKFQIEKGNALPELIYARESIQALKDCGFELILEQDVNEFAVKNNQMPWYSTMEAKYSIENIPHTRLGMFITDWMCWTLEKAGIAKPGTHATHQVLLTARDGLVAAGKLGIFTPMLLLVARKPQQ